MPWYNTQISILLALNIGPHLKNIFYSNLDFFNNTRNNATSSLVPPYAVFTWGTKTLLYCKVKQSLKHMQTQPSFHFITFLLLFSNELQFFQKKSSKVLHFLWNIRSKTLHYLVVATGIFNVLSNSVSCSLAHYDIIAFQCLLPLNNPVSILFPGLRYADCKCTIVPFTISVKQLTNDYVKKKKKKTLYLHISLLGKYTFSYCNWAGEVNLSPKTRSGRDRIAKRSPMGRRGGVNTPP